MAISFSRPDPSSPTAVAGAGFSTTRRGFDQNEVRDFLRMVSAELSRLQERVTFLERELANAQRAVSVLPTELDEETVAELLGEETARIVSAAREAANKIKTRSEETATRLVREATEEATRIREDAELEAARRRQDSTADAESEILMAKQQGRDMVNEARAYRERVLADVARRRELAREQLEDLFHSRDRLIQAFERARVATDDVLRELDEAGDEHNEFVNLAPTTSPVPIIVQADDVHEVESRRPMSTSAPSFAPYDQDDEVSAEITPTTPLSSVTPLVIVDDAVAEAPAVDEVIEVEDTVVEAVVETAAVVEAPVEPVVETDVESIVESVVETAPEVVEKPASEKPSNVVPLFGKQEPAPAVAQADDIFAKLRRSSVESVAKEVSKTVSKTEKKKPAKVDAPVEVEAAAPATTVTDALVEIDPLEASPFEIREEALSPVISAMARKVKRVLADEQSQVLDTLRKKTPVKTLDAIVGPKSEHAGRYTEAVESTVKSAGLTGAKSTSDANDSVLQKGFASHMAAINESIVASLVAPLRERLSRCISQAAGDNGELTSLVRVVYREWKSQIIDQHAEDIVRNAYGRGALSAVAKGVQISWVLDPTVEVCSDCNDNSLSAPVTAGEAFPTGHTHAPAHAGCRCAIVLHQN